MLLNNSAIQTQESRFSSGWDHADQTGLNELVAKISGYRKSYEYVELLKFMARFRQYAPYNCFLLHMQNPKIGYVANINEWRERFNRIVKQDARALVILEPWGPVQFVYDLSDTVGDNQQLPSELFQPFQTGGLLKPSTWHDTVKFCRKDGIVVVERSRSLTEAGCAIRLPSPEPSCQPKEPPIHYRIEINGNLDPATRYTTLIHELGHIYAGHLGRYPTAWWEDRSDVSSNICEFEAESIAYLIGRRLGLDSQSEKYLVGYLAEYDEIPEISFKAVLEVASAIERMGRNTFRRPKKPRSGTNEPDSFVDANEDAMQLNLFD